MQSMEGGLEQERLQKEAELNQRVNEEEVQNLVCRGFQNTQQHANSGTWCVELLRSRPHL